MKITYEMHFLDEVIVSFYVCSGVRVSVFMYTYDLYTYIYIYNFILQLITYYVWVMKCDNIVFWFIRVGVWCVWNCDYERVL